MTLPHATLSSLQTAGAAVYAADAELKKTAQELAEQVKLSMTQNPFDVSNDDLIDSWKSVARLAGAIAQIEVEFRKIYNAAADISGGALPALALPRGTATGKLDGFHDAVAKKSRKVAGKKARKARAGSAKAVVVVVKGQKPVKGNAAQLLTYLQGQLSTTDFTKVNWSNVAVATGIAKGSVGAARVKLLETGNLNEGPGATFKLAAPSA